MSRTIASTVVTRITIPLLLALLVVVLSGCAGWQERIGPKLSRPVTGGYQGNETLAVLLPESGRFAVSAKVVRDGIVAARKADPQGDRPKLRFYNSAAGSVTGLVQKAAADGARLVIGPLQKPAVNKLASSTALPSPVLALNRTLATAKPSNLYQFSLAPEGEVAEVVDKAWGEGHRKALILYPRDKWGNRISRAFQRKWKTHGGTLVTTQAFNPLARNFSGTAKKLSKHATGTDFIFLVADSKSVRRIWPQIRDKIGKDMRVYSTSHIYSGRVDPKRDKVLAGLNFVEIPWLVESTQGDPVSSVGLNKKLPRLYAMGVDAYRLGSRLGRLSANSQTRIQGKTGILRIDSQGRIHRKLTLARIDATGGPARIAVVDQGKRQASAQIGPGGALSKLLPSF